MMMTTPTTMMVECRPQAAKPATTTTTATPPDDYDDEFISICKSVAGLSNKPTRHSVTRFKRSSVRKAYLKFAHLGQRTKNVSLVLMR